MRPSWFWVWVLGASLLSGCAHWAAGEWRPVADTGKECRWAPVLHHVNGDTEIECRRARVPATARAMVVGQPGAALVGEAKGGSVTR